MATTISGATGAVLAAIAMTYEMTLDYNTILLVLIATTASWSTRKLLIGESVYTIKLLRRGHVVPEGLQSAMDHARRAGDIMKSAEDNTLSNTIETSGRGVDLVSAHGGQTVTHIVVGADALVVNVIKAMERSTDATVALVARDPAKSDADNILG